MTGGILSGPAISEAIKAGDIRLDPFNEKNINPASIDLTLGNGLTLYEDWVLQEADFLDHIRPFDQVLDVRKKPCLKSFTFSTFKGLVLRPGILYLMHTNESVWTEKYVPVLDGKSSIGRLGIQVHITAGYFDPGFEGQGTLEVTVVHPVRVYPGMKFCQMRFHPLVGELLSYQETGHYKGLDAKGAVASMTHLQFQEKA